MEVPTYSIDVVWPPVFSDLNEVRSHYIRYQKEQFRGLIAFLEQQTQRPFSEERFQQVCSRSFEAINLWKEILELSRQRPAPFAAFDAFIHMAPIVTLRGTHWAVRYYRKLKRELDERVRNGVGAFAREEIRLIWDNIPIWYDIRNLSKLLSSRGAVLVADTYTSAWSLEQIDSAQPLKALARAYATIHLNQGLEYKIQKIANMIENYGAHGLMMHSNRSCKPYSLGQYDLKRAVSQATGKPALIIEADHTDSRSYAPAQVEKQIEIFLEIIKGRDQK